MSAAVVATTLFAGTATTAVAANSAARKPLVHANDVIGQRALSESPRVLSLAADPSSINPPADVPEPPQVLESCNRVSPVASTSCIEVLVAAINAARAVEGVRRLVLDPSSFNSLSVPEQLFVVTNLERLDRGLQPLTGMTAQLDAIAQAGANALGDPAFNFTSLSGGTPLRVGVSNWAGGFSGALEADYFWMYDDGFGSPNVDCPNPSAAECWGHRRDILYEPATCRAQPSVNVMGAAFADHGESSYAEIFVSACGPPPSDVVFTWSDAQALLAGTGHGQMGGSSELPSVSAGGPYSAWLGASDGPTRSRWIFVSGSLPSGLTLLPDGHLVGYADNQLPGAYSFTAQAYRSGGFPAHATRTFVVTLTASQPLPAEQQRRAAPPVRTLSPRLHAEETVRMHRGERKAMLLVTVARHQRGQVITVEARLGSTWVHLARLRSPADGRARFRVLYGLRRPPTLRVVVSPSGRYRGESRRAAIAS